MSPVPTGPHDWDLPDPKFLDCLSTECQTAKAATVDTANEIILKCSDIAAASARAVAFLAIASTILGVAGALTGYIVGAIGVAAAIALITTAVVSLNWLIVWAIITLVATALVFVTLWAITMVQVAILQANLGALKTKFSAQATDVENSCPPTCWGDLRIPLC
jgi:hypothetical protein